ncbi:hypothetical protein MPH_02089 [Macrophomina phaseolina MS6]|uniref:Uncharacterized protein n=1 Tax=Macrophomina phaseolina (strain MS6) TaxID=1126212 RepID=K2S6P8_MACPH|nr:hypothetical protein MPH_02089 [Macrophomina phaseolina MS6]
MDDSAHVPACSTISYAREIHRASFSCNSRRQLMRQLKHLYVVLGGSSASVLKRCLFCSRGKRRPLARPGPSFSTSSVGFGMGLWRNMGFPDSLSYDLRSVRRHSHETVSLQKAPCSVFSPISGSPRIVVPNTTNPLVISLGVSNNLTEAPVNLVAA